MKSALVNSQGLLVLAMLVGVVYLPYAANPLVFDDLNLFNGAANVNYALGFHFEPRWLPLATLAHNYFLSDGSVVAMRMGNMLLHLANVFAVFVLLRELFSALRYPAAVPGQMDTQACAFAFWAAALYAVHPVAVYAVGYLVQRTLLMSTLFMLLMWITHLRWLTSGRRALWVWSAVWYALSVFSKEHSVMAPVATLLMCVLLKDKIQYRDRFTRFLMPYATYCVIALVVVYMARSPLGKAFEPVVSQPLGDVLDGGMTWAQSMWNQAAIYFKYLSLWLAPAVNKMSIDVRVPVMSTPLSTPTLLTALAFLGYPLIAVILIWRGGRFAPLGWVLAPPWFLFLTELSTVREHEPFVLYRAYLWFPLIGALAPLAVSRLNPRAMMLLGVPVLALMIALSWNRLDSMTSPFRVWDDAAKLLIRGDEPGAGRIYYNRSKALIALGEKERALQDMNRVIVLHPKLEPAYTARAKIYFQMGQWPSAQRDFDHAIVLVPENADTYYLRAMTRRRMEQVDQAQQDLRKACDLKHVVACMVLQK